MPYKDLLIKRQKQAAYHEKNKTRGYCKLCGNKKENRHRQSCDACIPAYDKALADKKYQLAHPEQRAVISQTYHQKLRHEAIVAYGGYQCSCECNCNSTESEYLSLDHIHGGGNKHRKLLKGKSIFFYLKRAGYPPGFRVLCHNCNASKGYYGYCPREQKIGLPSAVGIKSLRNRIETQILDSLAA
jgi:hypothetical protein